MSTTIETELLAGGITVGPGALSIFVRMFVHAGDVDALSTLLDVVVQHKPEGFEQTYELFEPVLSLLDMQDAMTMPNGFDIEAVVLDWATRLGLLRADYLSAILAREQLAISADWLMEVGADPNAVLNPEAAEPLTVIGHVCRVMRHQHRCDDTVRAMIREVLARGEVPYSVKPRYEGDPGACDLFTAILNGIDNADRATTALFEAVGLAMNAGQMPAQAEETIGRMCLAAGAITEYHRTNVNHGISYQALSYARFLDPSDWEKAFKNFEFSTDSLFLMHGFDTPHRLIKAMVRDGAQVDSIPAFVTDDRIACTLLQAAAFAGQEWAVKQLVEAGADPKLTVAAGSNRYPIGGLDAAGLWNGWSGRGRSHVLDAVTAKNAIDSVISQAKVGRGTQAGNP